MDMTDYGETLFVSAKMTLFQTVICCGPQGGLVTWHPWLAPEPPKKAPLPVALIRGEYVSATAGILGPHPAGPLTAHSRLVLS